MGVSLKKFAESFEKGGGKGGFGTHQRASATWIALDRFAEKNGWRSVDPESISTKQIRSFIEHRSQNISARSVQNEVSHIRRACRGSGRDTGELSDKRNNWSAERLAVPSGSRIGGKAAANPEVLSKAIAAAPRDISVALSLCAALGLRRQEAVMSSASLQGWASTLSRSKEYGHSASIAVNHGTKGGKTRGTFVPEHRVEQALCAVEKALSHVSDTKDGLIIEIENPKGGLKAAMARMSNACTSLELMGQNSCHGARRLFAHDQYDYFTKEAGFSHDEALSKLSDDLGHGPTRGRWVWNNYLLGGRG